MPQPYGGINSSTEDLQVSSINGTTGAFVKECRPGLGKGDGHSDATRGVSENVTLIVDSVT